MVAPTISFTQIPQHVLKLFCLLEGHQASSCLQTIRSLTVFPKSDHLRVLSPGDLSVLLSYRAPFLVAAPATWETHFVTFHHTFLGEVSQRKRVNHCHSAPLQDVMEPTMINP